MTANGDPPRQLLGRDAEWASIQTFVDDIPAGPSGAVLEGEAGIGKTALWTAAIELAARRPGHRVLRARPAGGDASISYAVLLELFDRLAGDTVADLPPPQREALEVALRRRPAAGDIDPGTVAVATLGVVRSLADDGPVLIAIDDLQEADPASLRVLEFVVRRLSTEPVGLLLARRPSADRSGSLRLAEAFSADRVRLVRPVGLSVGALNRLLTDRLGVSFARPLVVRIHAMTAGNPQFALEIGRELSANGVIRLPASAPLPVPGTVQEIVGSRLARLDQATREVVAFAAEMERPSLDRLRLVTADADGALDAAVAAEVLVVDGDTVRFTHPTIRAAAALAVPERQRRAAHARLAELTADPEERAHHLGRSVAAPDAGVAATVEAGAEAAARRGAPEAALRLRERALELTPESDRQALARRRLILADGVSDAGDLQRARGLLELVLAEDGIAPETRFEATILLGTLLWYEDEGDAGRRLLRRALDEAADHRLWQARIHSRLGWMADDDVAAAAAHADAALALMSPDEDPAAYAFALLSRTVQTVLAGGPPDEAAIRRGDALQLAAASGEISALAGLWPKYADRFAESRTWLEQDLERVRALGDEASMGQTLGYLAELEAWAGNLSMARRHAEEGLDLIRHIGQQGMIVVAIGRLTLVDVIAGNEAAADQRLDEMRRLSVDTTDPWIGAMCDQTEAAIAIAAGDLARADRAASHATELLDGIGLVEPAMFRYHADQIEAVIGLGELERAERLLRRFEERHRTFPRPWIAATSARCRALLAAARGDHEEAVAQLDRSLAAHEQLDFPVERIRTLIAGAQVLRRANRRKRGYELATEAERLAGDIGAAGWAAKAQAEAARLGLDRGAPEQLTPSERRVAELAAGGSTNREIADRLLISPKTVEATLGRAYAKLGIRSRAQLHAGLQGIDHST